MNEKELAGLQPTAQTGAEIRNALYRIAGAESSALSRIADLEAEVAEKTKTFKLPTALGRKLSDQIADHRQDVAMLKTLAAEVWAPLADIERRERDARLGEQHSALEARMEGFTQKFQAAYWPHHEALVSLLEENAEIIREAEAHNRETRDIFRPISLADFRRPHDELRLCKTRRERLLDQVAERWGITSAQYQRALPLDDDALAAGLETPDAQPSERRSGLRFTDPDARPTLTIGGVVQGGPRFGY